MPDGPGIGDRQRRLLRLVDAHRTLDDLRARGLPVNSVEKTVALTEEALDSMIAYRDLLADAVRHGPIGIVKK